MSMSERDSICALSENLLPAFATARPHAKTTCVYVLWCVPLRKFYIGSTKSLRHRMHYHHFRFRQGTHPNIEMQQAFNDHGASAFVVGVLEYCEVASALASEQRWLDAVRAGKNAECFNVLAVAGSHIGRKRPAETCARLSASLKGRVTSDEAKSKMRAAKLGRKLSPEHRRKLSEVRTGMPCNRPEGIINHSLRRFSNEQVVAIRNDRAAGMSWGELAAKYNADAGPIRRLTIRKTYKDVP
jgi:group I intron endonuclease